MFTFVRSNYNLSPTQVLQLSVFPISFQTESFQIWTSESLENDSNHYKQYYISKEDKATTYFVSFESIEGFVSIDVHPLENINLTLSYLLFILEKEIVSKDFVIYRPEKVIKTKELEIVLKEESEGYRIAIHRPVFIPEKQVFGINISYRFRRKLEVPFNRRIQILSLSITQDGKKNIAHYQNKWDIIQWCYRNILSKISVTNFSIGDSCVQLNQKMLKNKVYVFGDNKESNSQYLGLINYKPYEKVNREFNFIFVFKDGDNALANLLYLGLIGKEHPNSFAGMEKVFDVKFNKSLVTKYILTDNIDNDIRNLIQLSSKDTFIIFVVDDQTSDSTDRYYKCKLQFTLHGIPTQFIDITTIKNSYSMRFSIASIALQIFCKMGGKPWVVKPEVPDSIIIGLGTSYLRSESGIVKHIAYSILFDSSGLFKKIEILANTSHFEDYISSLAESLNKVFGEIDTTKYSRVVIHTPYRISIKDLDILKSVIFAHKSNLGFEVLKINTHNDIMGFAKSNSMIPYESTLVPLSKQRFLVWFEGLQYGKDFVNKFIPEPVLIERLYLEGQDHLIGEAIIQDAINLSGANWRGFNSKLEPVSILYSKIFAKFCQEFSQYPEFDLKNLANNFPWFL